MKIRVSAAVFGAVLLMSGSAYAADLYAPAPEPIPAPMPAPAPIGGWYFSGFGGVNWLDKTSFDVDLGGEAELGLMIDPTSCDGVDYLSRESSKPPELTVEYEPNQPPGE